MGTRFLASIEAPISEAWKQAILAAESDDAIKVDVWGDIFPLRSGDYPAIPRALGSPFVDEWRDRREAAAQQAERLRGEIGAAIGRGEFVELFPFAGQSAGLVHEILPAADLLRRLAAETEKALKRAEAYIQA